MPEEPEGQDNTPSPNPAEPNRGSDEPRSLDQPPSFFPYQDRDSRQPELGPLVEVEVEGVFAAEAEGQMKSLFVVLSSRGHRLPIVIGQFEAEAISIALENAEPERPRTHDLIRTIIDRLEGSVEKIVIDDLWNGVYYAKLVLGKADGEAEIDCRPSDAIAIAVRYGAPIYVAEGLLEQE